MDDQKTDRLTEMTSGERKAMQDKMTGRITTDKRRQTAHETDSRVQRPPRNERATINRIERRPWADDDGQRREVRRQKMDNDAANRRESYKTHERWREFQWTYVNEKRNPP